MKEPFELTVRKTISAPRKSVFEAWLNPQALASFMKPMPEMPDCRVELDARQGGEFLIVMMAGDAEIQHRGQYKIIDKYERLVFTWISDHTMPDSTVTLDFLEKGPTETELILHHVGFPGEEQRNNHEGGWRQIIETLALTLA